MTSLPAAYQWLASPSLAPLPRMVEEALREFGVVEGAGAADNPTILGWAREVGVEAVYSHDAIPWCGLFMALVAKRAGKLVPDQPLWALSWARFGRTLAVHETIALGDVLVFRRDGGGHVAMYVGEDDHAFHVLGGNQADQVCFTSIAKIRLYTARRPLYRVPPRSARTFLLAASGALSENEA